MTTLRDEIEDEMYALSTAQTDGLTLHEYTCEYHWQRERPQRQQYEAERKARRETDAAFREQERERWRRANEARARKRWRQAEAARLQALAVVKRERTVPSLTSAPW